jgi:hypothetical protein
MRKILTEGFPGRKYGIPPTNTVCPLLRTDMDDCSAFPAKADPTTEPMALHLNSHNMMNGIMKRRRLPLDKEIQPARIGFHISGTPAILVEGWENKSTRSGRNCDP